MKFKVYVNTYGDPDGSFATNAMEYDTQDDAVAAAKDLHWRWTAVETWQVRSDDGAVVEEGP
jgi:hypothetical protein